MLPAIRLVTAPQPVEPTPPADGALREHLVLRLLAAAELQDAAAAQRIIAELLDHDWLGPQLAGAVMGRLGRSLAGA